MSEAPRRQTVSSRTRARLIGAAVLAAVLIAFVVQNGRTVRVRFLLFEFDTRLAFALIVAGVLGLLLGFLLPRVRRFL